LYNLLVYNNILGIRTAKDENILKINGMGNIFYKTTQKNADININGSMDITSINVKSLDINKLNINNSELVVNFNAEFLCGKKGPENGEIVSTKDKQELWNKSFGNDLILNYNRIVNLSDPIYDTDAVTKRYVDRYLSGLKIGRSVKCASIENVDCDYEKRSMKLYLRTVENFNSEELTNLFDGYSLKMHDRCILFNQLDETQNGIYYVTADGLDGTRKTLERVEDFCKRQTAEELKSYYVFVENGIKYGNNGYVYEYQEDFTWDETGIKFNIFSKTENYGTGNGIKKVRNNFALNISDEFTFNNGQLELKKGLIGNEYLKNNHINLTGEGGIELDKSVIKLGDNVKIGIKIDKKQFHFGKNGELKISSSMKSEKISNEELNINKNVSAMGFQNVYQIFPPNKFEVNMQYSEDFFEKEKDKIVQYFICCLNSEGKETNYKSSDEIYFSDDVKSIFVNLDWENVSGNDGYILYRRINSAYYSVKLTSVETSLLDILVPRNFTKIDWKPCSEPENINKTVLVVNKFSTLGANYITGGALGIGTVNPRSALHISSNNVNSNGSALTIESDERDKEIMHLIKKGISSGGVRILGESMSGKSLIEMGKNVKLLTDNDGVVFLGRSDELFDINERLGSDEYTVQLTDGGLFSYGDILIGENRSYGTFNNKLGNNAAVLKTGCVSSSIANQVAFTWEGETLNAVPLYDGNMVTKKKVSVKNFTIQHPLDENRYLVHACLEGATADVFYRGYDIIQKGYEFVDILLPDFYSQLVKFGSSTIQLTPIGKPFFRLGGEVIAESMIRVYLDNIYDMDAKFNWEIKGERIGTAFDSEPLKKDVNVQGFGPYTYYL